MALALLAFVAQAGSDKTIRQQTELSMVVKAAIDIRPDGSVDRYQLVDAAKIPASVVGIVARQVPRWKFEPELADGKPVAVHTDATLRIVAKPNDDGSYSAGILDAGFSGGKADKESSVRIRKQEPPLTFPSLGFLVGMTGDVYAVLKIGPEGKVLDAIVQKVDLTASASEKLMARARRTLGDRVLEVVRQWRFDVPTRGKFAGQPYWTGTLPVIFTFDDSAADRSYGEWRAFIPGPCTKVPWPVLEPRDANDDACNFGPTKLGSGGPELLTPLMQP